MCLFCFSGVRGVGGSQKIYYERGCAHFRGKRLLGSALCARHQGPCSNQAVIDGDISGSPCTAWSVAGTRKKKKDPRVQPLVAWCMVMRAKKPPWAIHENVRGFDRSVLDEHLGDLYRITCVASSPAHVGFPISRPRRYFVLIMEGRQAADPQAVYAAICQAFQPGPSVPWHAYLLATEQDLLKEENRARARRSLPALSDPSPDWTYLLTPKEKGFLSEYESMWFLERGGEASRDPCCVFNLAQNPRKRPCATTRAGYVPTLTRTGGHLWVPLCKRWMCAIELAALVGFLVRPDLAAASRYVDVCCGQYTRAQLGNAMHVANVGCVLGTALACVTRSAHVGGVSPHGHEGPAA